MKIIAITTPNVHENDALLITNLMEKGVDFVHLRKPDSDIDDCRKLLANLPESHRRRIIIHDYPELYHEFSLGGIHINKNVTTLPCNYSGLKTRSCHSFDEVLEHKHHYNYVFLSPIFDSISKSGYQSAFSHHDLQKAAQSGIIDEKVIALGGVTLQHINYLKTLNFGGAAMIGAIYNLEALSTITDLSSYR